jgi:hypothetical protein
VGTTPDSDKIARISAARNGCRKIVTITDTLTFSPKMGFDNGGRICTRLLREDRDTLWSLLLETMVISDLATVHVVHTAYITGSFFREPWLDRDPIPIGS